MPANEAAPAPTVCTVNLLLTPVSETHKISSVLCQLLHVHVDIIDIRLAHAILWRKPSKFP